jgi:hypothetical protein
MANSNNWGEIYNSTWWGDKAWSANTLFIDSAPPGFGLNLLKGSEDLDNTIDWKQVLSSVVANSTDEAAPNSTDTAEKITFTADRQSRIQQQIDLEANTTFSVYAKVRTGTKAFRLRNSTLGQAQQFTADTSWGLNPDDGRYSFSFTTGATAITHTLSIQNAAAGGSGEVFFWGAMLNEGATAGDYVKTDASVSGSAPTPVYSGFGDAFGGVTAYYSLRQFTEAETLNAIRVRRSSDDTEQDIGFDANGDLDTTALTTFVNADVTKADTDFSSGFTGTSESGLDRLANQSIGERSGVLKGTIQATTEEHRLIISAVDTAANTHRIQTSIYIPSGQSGQTVDGFRIENGGLQVYATTTTKDAWVDIDVTWTSVPNANVFIKFLPSGGAENWTGNGTDEVYIGDITITQTTADGAVTTFYDQSGNGNNATNSTESEQPLVVSGGTLVEENGKAPMQFDGVNDVLTLPASIGTPFTGQGKAISSFSVSSIVSGNKTLWSITGTGNDDYYFSSHDGSKFRFFARGGSGTLKASASSSTFGAGQYLKSDILPEEAASVQNGDMYIDGTQEVTSFDYATASKTLDRGGGIGALVRGSVSGNFNGKHQELIFFDSDQSSNRTGIETNINDHFSIYP